MSDVSNSVGTEFDVVYDAKYQKDMTLCTKYICTSAMKQMRQSTPKKKLSFFEKIFSKFNKKKSILIEGQFNFHIDTPHFAKNVHRLNLDDHISITQKMHGTSFVASKVLTKKKLSFKEKAAAFCGVQVIDSEYTNLYSSRKVIKNLNSGQSSYYKVDIWELVNKKIVDSLRPGMSVYGEIVGYIPNGGYIQKNYDYGCEKDKYNFYIYRITTTDPQGHVLEWSWEQIKAWCNMTGFNHVPELFNGYLRNWKNGNFEFSNLLE